MTQQDEARQTLTTWTTMSEWTRIKNEIRRKDARIQEGFNHLFGGTPFTQKSSNHSG